MAKKKVEKELTREEKIEQVYSHFVSMRDATDLPVVESRILKVGDKVEVGNLQDCVVAEIRDEGRSIIIEYTHHNHNYGNPIFTPGTFGCWSWHEVYNLNYATDETICHNAPVRVSYISTDLRGILFQALRRGLIDNPDYQRGYVWSNEDKEALIESLIEDRDIGKFIFVEDKSYNEYRLEVLDGKQRLNTLIEFYTSKFPYKGKYYHEFSKQDRYTMESRHAQSASIDSNQHTRAELLATFLNVNAGGVPQTEEHLDYVRELLAKELEKE